MYAARLGGRWRATNPFLDLETAPVRLAFGSDSPVTPVDPWAAVRAAARHRNDGQRLSLPVAFRAHTRGGAFASRDDEGGDLTVGARADLAVWAVPGGLTDDDLPDLTPGLEPPRLLRTVSEGRTIHRTDEPHNGQDNP
jgi:predicted amidohydrolase YtcJ